MRARYTLEIISKDGSTKHYQPINQNRISIRSTLNGGQSKISLVLAENANVDFVDLVKIRVYINGQRFLIYSGFVNAITYVQAKQMNLVKRIDCLGLAAILGFSVVSELYQNYNKKNALKNLINRQTDLYWGWVTANDEDIEESGSISQRFFEQYPKNIISDIQKKTNGFHWYIGADGRFSFKKKPVSPSHIFTFGKDFFEYTSPQIVKNTENRIRVIYNNLGDYSEAIDEESIDKYGIRTAPSRRNDVMTQTLAQNWANEILETQKPLEIRPKITISRSYPLETINPGDTCTIVNTRHAHHFEPNMLIYSVRYTQDTVQIEVENIDSLGGAIF